MKPAGWPHFIVYPYPFPQQVVCGRYSDAAQAAQEAAAELHGVRRLLKSGPTRLVVIETAKRRVTEYDVQVLGEQSGCVQIQAELVSPTREGEGEA
jgi:hypothetical protein